jgi:type IV pilus assembly protein PilY1
MGRAIYMVDATTGARLWMAGNNTVTGTAPNLTINEMDYSIPSDVTIIDTNGDGYTDRLYVGDMGGQVFRLDFANGTNTGASNFATGGRIADLAGFLPADNRRFYYAPDVALARLDGSLYLNIAIGSGYREHPLNTTIVDRMYALRDFHVTDAVATAAITESTLFNLTDVVIPSTDPLVQAAFESADGWYIILEGLDPDGNPHPGEKVLAKALTFNGILSFNTFDPTPTEAATNACTLTPGQGRGYAVNFITGSAVADLNSTATGKLDRVTLLDRGGIPPEPVVVFRDSGDTIEPTLLIGSEVILPVTAVLKPGVKEAKGAGNSECIDALIGKACKTWWRDQP